MKALSNKLIKKIRVTYTLIQVFTSESRIGATNIYHHLEKGEKKDMVDTLAKTKKKKREKKKL